MLIIANSILIYSPRRKQGLPEPLHLVFHQNLVSGPKVVTFAASLIFQRSHPQLWKRRVSCSMNFCPSSRRTAQRRSLSLLCSPQRRLFATKSIGMGTSSCNSNLEVFAKFQLFLKFLTPWRCSAPCSTRTIECQKRIYFLCRALFCAPATTTTLFPHWCASPCWQHFEPIPVCSCTWCTHWFRRSATQLVIGLPWTTTGSTDG